MKYIWEKEDINKCGAFVELDLSGKSWKGKVWKIGYVYIDGNQYYTKTNILTDGFTFYYSTAEKFLEYLNSDKINAAPITIKDAVKLYGENEVNYIK